MFRHIGDDDEALAIRRKVPEVVTINEVSPYAVRGCESANLRVSVKRSLGGIKIADQINSMSKYLAHRLRPLDEELGVTRALFAAMQFLCTLKLVASSVLQTQRSHGVIFAHAGPPGTRGEIKNVRTK